MSRSMLLALELRPLGHGLPLLCGFGRLSSKSSLEADLTTGPRLRGRPASSSSSSASLLSPLSRAASAAAPICADDCLRICCRSTCKTDTYCKFAG